MSSLVIPLQAFLVINKMHTFIKKYLGKYLGICQICSPIIETEQTSLVPPTVKEVEELMSRIEDRQKKELIFFCNDLIFILVEVCNLQMSAIIEAINNTLDYFEVEKTTGLINSPPDPSSFIDHQTFQNSVNLLKNSAEALNSSDDLAVAHFLFVYQLLHGQQEILATLRGFKDLFSEFACLKDEGLSDEPWCLVAALIQKVHHLSNQRLHQQAFTRWFLNHMTIERIVFHSSPNIFRHFRIVIESNIVKKPEMEVHHLHLMYGLMEFLSKSTNYSDAQQDKIRNAKMASRALSEMFSIQRQKEQDLPFSIPQHSIREDLLKMMDYIMGETRCKRLKSRCTVNILSQGHESQNMH